MKFEKCNPDKMVVGKTYCLLFPNRKTITVKFSGLINYSYLPSDCVFEFVSGDTDLIEASSMKKENKFPLPIGLMPKVMIKEMRNV